MKSLWHVLGGALLLALAASVLAPASAHAGMYYVAPNGSDTGRDGSIDQPFASMAHAQAIAKPGDTFYFRGGTYAYTAGTTTCASATSTINAVLLNVSGSAGSPIRYVAYMGETPVFDFSGIKDACRITGIRVTASWVQLKGLELRGVPQNNNANHESWGVWSSGSNNVFEQLNLHHHMGPGLFIQNGSNNFVLNCDSHDNYDPNSSTGPGTNADGFGCHIGSAGTGNVFRGCRAWYNSDDGYDLIQAQVPVLIESSWAWGSGYLSGTTTASGGDGNGFKGGGYGLPQTNLPASPPQHTIRSCVAFQNRAAGFYANHHPVGNFWYSNTAFNNNSANFDMLGYAGGAALNVGVLRNNLAFMRTLLAHGAGAQVDEQFNSWDASLGITASAADFQSVSTTGWDAPRAADGSLPVLSSLHLAAGSGLIDRGTDVGLPFNDAAPDLGAFETGPPLGAAGSGAAGAAGGGAGAGGGGTGGSTAADGGGLVSAGSGAPLAGGGGASGEAGTSGLGVSGAGAAGTSGDAGMQGLGAAAAAAQRPALGSGRSAGCACQVVGSRSTASRGASAASSPRSR